MSSPTTSNDLTNDLNAISKFARWDLDLIGPQEKPSNGNSYIVTATEYSTKWSEAKAISNNTATTIGGFIWELITRFGSPKDIYTDQDSEFCDDLKKILLDNFNVSGTAYHPRTNVHTERFNPILVTQLLKVVEEKVDDWDQHVIDILISYRGCEQKSTKDSPFELMYGVKFRSPIQLNNSARSANESPMQPTVMKVRLLTAFSKDERRQAAITFDCVPTENALPDLHYGDFAKVPRKDCSKIPEDENCFFRAIAYLLTGDETQHPRIRKYVVQQMNKCKKFDTYFNQEYISRMADDNVPATHKEIRLTASLLKCDIVVWAMHGEQMKWMIYTASFPQDTYSPKCIILKMDSDHYEPVIYLTKKR